MAITYAEITGPTPKWAGTEIYQRLRVEAWPNTTNEHMTWAATNETHDGPVVRETTAAGTFDTPFLIPLGSDQGAVAWTFLITPLDRIPGVTTTKRQRLGSKVITASVDWDTLVAEFTDLTAVTPDIINDVAANAAAAQQARDEAEAFGGTNNTQVAGMVTGAGPTKDALSATFAGKGGDKSDTLAPLFVNTIVTGLRTPVPANLLADGTPIIAVTGTKGSKILTTTETAKVSGLGANPFEAALNATDGSDDLFVTVMSHNGSTQITLRKALTADFTGTLQSKYDGALGQHLTAGATRAYAQHVSKATGVIGSRGAILDGAWASRPSTYQTMWVRNAAMIAYGTSNSAAPVVTTSVAIPVATNVLTTGGAPITANPLTKAGVQVGTHVAGHGAEATLYPGRRPVVLEFYTAAQRPTTNLDGIAQLTVTVKADGRLVYSETHDNALTAVRLPILADKIEVSVTNADGAIYNIYLTQATLREAGLGGTPFGPTKKVVCLMDSWGQYHSGAFATTLAEKTGAKVINHSLGGMTSEWALSWFDTYVLAEKPDVCVLHFYTNDANNLSAETFTTPTGASQAKWPSGLTDAQSQVRWRENMLLLAQKCRENGIKPVIILPGGTASESQMQKHVEWSWAIDRPPFLEPTSTSTELADTTAYVNTVGKRTGAVARIGTSRRYAAGPLAADAWSNTTDDALVPLQKKTLRLSTYAATSTLAIGTDTNADGLSDGMVTQGWGTMAGDTYTPSIVGGYQKITSAYAASGATGNKRYGFTFTAVAAKEYLVLFDIINAPASSVFNDSVSDLTGASTSITSTNGITTVDASGAGPVAYRATANASGSKSAYVQIGRTNGVTRDFTIKRAVAVDLAALFADAPNVQGMSTAELAAYCLALLP